MLGELAVTGVVRFLGDCFQQVVGEVLIRGFGYGICRLFNRSANPNGVPVAIIGVAFWLVVGGLGYYTYKHIWWRL
jgi:hypothetical protein